MKNRIVSIKIMAILMTVILTTPINSQTVYHCARYCESGGFSLDNHIDEFVIDYSLECWNGSTFDANVGKYTNENIDVIFVGGDNTFSNSTALTIEDAVYNEGKVFVINFWSNRNFDASLPAVNVGDAPYGSYLTIEDPNNPIFEGLPEIFYNSGPNYNREHAVEKEGSTVLMRFDNGDPALLYWQYGNGYVIEWTIECMHQFFQGDDLDTIVYRLLKLVLEGVVPSPLTYVGWPCDGYDPCWSYCFPFQTEQSIQNLPFGEDWSVNVDNPLALTGDINGDGMPEIIYTSNNMLHVLNGDGQALWNKNLEFIESGYRVLLADVTGDGVPEIIIGTRLNSTLKLLFFDGSGVLIKEIIESEGVSEDNFIHARAITDIDNDGSLEVVAWRGSGYDLWSRGVEVFDYESGNREWFYSTGPHVPSVNIADITGDNRKEILTGTVGVANGHSVNGFSDNKSYAICWDADGNLLWSRQFEGSGFVDSYVSVNDLNGDGMNEVIYTSLDHGWQWWDGDIGRIYLLNPDDGEILKEYNADNPVIVNGIADITGNGTKEILVDYQDDETQTGKILMFDNELNLLHEYIVSGSILRVCAINDLNGDGILEIIVRQVMNNAFVVLDQNLNELWSLSFPDEVKDVIPTDLNNDGFNELIISTQNTLQVREYKFPPSFTLNIDDKVSCMKDSVAFEVIAEGVPPIHYQWQKDEENIAGATETALIISGIQPDDAGEYRCIATNDYGSDTANTAMLTVEFAVPTTITGLINVIEYELATYSVEMQEGHTYEFLVEGGNKIDGTENSVTVHWGAAVDGYIKLMEISEIGCIADTNILKVTIGSLGMEEHEQQALQVIPNPFTYSTTIQYKTKHPGNIEIKIFNQWGKLVEMMSAKSKAGENSFILNAHGLSPGIYLLCLQTRNELVTQKIVKH